jgi:diguanylate cyclase (GGDEF)-like protein
MAKIHVLDVNQRTLKLFGAGSKEELLENLGSVFRDEMASHFRQELIDMWQGHLGYTVEGVNYALSGEPIDIQLHWSVMPGYEADLKRVLVSIIDITARKKAEAYLKYLGTHDVLTSLYNRAYFEEERIRLERGRRFPVTVLILDVDGLKQVNDNQGHAAGDDLLRRVAEVLRSSFRAEDVVARIGGDEFAVLLPNTDAPAAAQSVERIHRLIELNNAFYQGVALSLSIGAATAGSGGNLEEAQRAADDRMYQDKRRRKTGRPDL